jgi:hypothetical protein
MVPAPLVDLDLTILQLVARFVERQRLARELLVAQTPDFFSSRRRAPSKAYVRAVSHGRWGSDEAWTYRIHGHGCTMRNETTGEPIRWVSPDLARFDPYWFVEWIAWRLDRDEEDATAAVRRHLSVEARERAALADPERAEHHEPPDAARLHRADDVAEVSSHPGELGGIKHELVRATCEGCDVMPARVRAAFTASAPVPWDAPMTRMRMRGASPWGQARAAPPMSGASGGRCAPPTSAACAAPATICGGSPS